MGFCTKCGAQIPDDAVFCTGCGTAVASPAPEASQAPGYQAPPQQNYQQAPPPQQGYQQAPPQQGYPQQGYQNYADPRWDGDNNKVYGILAYFGLLVLVSILAAPKESRFSRFHANQGLVLLIINAAGAIILSILAGILIGIIAAVGSMGLVALITVIVYIVCFAFGIFLFVIAIMGIVSAAKGEMKPLPIVGKFTILK